MKVAEAVEEEKEGHCSCLEQCPALRLLEQVDDNEAGLDVAAQVQILAKLKRKSAVRLNSLLIAFWFCFKCCSSLRLMQFTRKIKDSLCWF
jgi:hypothetical protein